MSSSATCPAIRPPPAWAATSPTPSSSTAPADTLPHGTSRAGPPLAYVFWHTPAPDHPISAYEATLLGFHVALADDPPPGFIASWTARITTTYWMPAPDGGYEDWYLVDDFAALDRLNAAAVSGTRGAPHDAAAAHASTGTAGLYRAWTADIPPPARTMVTDWLGKPPGLSYPDWRDALTDALDRGAIVWQRQLTLGPTPEFAVRAPADQALPWPSLRTTATLIQAA